jgi:hypothetical protein
MAEIDGLEGLDPTALARELDRGGRFVSFTWCVSLVLITFKRPSKVFFVRSGEGTLGRSLPYTLLSLVFGWWGFPWGPIYTLWAVVSNLGGGTDVTDEVVGALLGSQAPE